MFKTIASWFSASSSAQEPQYPIKTIEDVKEMIHDRVSFKARIDKTTYKQLQAIVMPRFGEHNMMGAFYNSGVYYDGRRQILNSTDYINDVVFPQITIIPKREENNGTV